MHLDRLLADAKSEGDRLVGVTFDQKFEFSRIKRTTEPIGAPDGDLYLLRPPGQ